MCISWWESTQYVQKPKPGRLPRPDGTFDYGASQIGAPDRKLPETSGGFQPVSGNQGIRESGVVGESDDCPDGPEGSARPSDKNDRDDIRKILDHLDRRITESDPDARLPNRTKANLDAARLLIDKDGRTVEQVKAAIDFALHDEFWRTNIRSMSKLRDKYDTLRAQAMRKSGQQAAAHKNAPTGSILWDDDARKKIHERPQHLTDSDHL